MKKISLLLILAVPLLLTACGPNQNQQSNQGGEQTQPQTNKFSLKNALTLGQSVKCSYTDDKGTTVTSLVKGNKYKVSGISMGEDSGSGGMVSDGQYMYAWDDVTKQGTKFDITAMQELSQEPQSTTSPESAFDFQKWADETDNKYKVDCQPAVVTDAEFIPPSDITFQDMTQFMQQMGEFSKKMQANPDGTPNTEDLESMQELFKGMNPSEMPEDE